MNILFAVLLVPFRVIKWIISLVVGSVIKIVILVGVVFLIGYCGLDYIGVIDSPYLDPIWAGFDSGERLD